MLLKLSAFIISLFFLTSTVFAAEDSFVFYVMTDSHLVVNKDGTFAPFPSTVKIVGDIVTSKPDFVIHCGDMIHAGPMRHSPETAVKMWSAFRSSVRLPFEKAAIPLFVTRGNHDVYGKVLPSYINEWKNGEPKTIKLTSGRFEQWYSFEYGNCLFIVLDGHALSLSDEQCEWLEKMIFAGRGKNAVFVVSHVGLAGGSRHPFEYMQGKGAELLKNSPYELWLLSGHHHIYDVQKKGNVTNIISGCAGHRAASYLKVTVSGKNVRLEPLKLSE